MDITTMQAFEAFNKAKSNNTGSIYFGPKSDEELVQGLNFVPDYARNAIRSKLAERAAAMTPPAAPVAAPDPNEVYQNHIVDILTRQSRPSMSSGRMVGGLLPDNPDRDFASLQTDEDYKRLSGANQDKVLSSRYGAEGERMRGLQQLATQIKLRQTLNNQDRLDDDSRLPIEMTKELLKKGKLRLHPEHGLMQSVNSDIPGQPDTWEPADPFVIQNARQAWKYLYPGEELPLNTKQQQALDMLSKGMKPDAIKQSLGAAPSQNVLVPGASRILGDTTSEGVGSGLKGREAIGTFLTETLPDTRSGMRQDVASMIWNTAVKTANASQYLREAITGNPGKRFAPTNPRKIRDIENNILQYFKDHTGDVHNEEVQLGY